jgi:two-component system NtrC family sensor kinase
MNKLIDSMISQVNVVGQCKKYGISVWQCPQFLFLVMGAAIILASVATYLIGTVYNSDPESVALVVCVLTIFLLVLAFVIMQSFERLAETNRLKSEFVSIVSHQIRSPLTNLKWIVELLMSGILGKIEDKQTEYFKILKENLERMQELVSELLTVSRIEATKLVFRREEFSLENMIRDLINEFKPIAKSSNVKLEFSADKNLPRVYSDPFQILQVVENLLYNAIRYTNFPCSANENEKGSGKVIVRLFKKGNVAVCEVEDNGIGIPAGDQKFIFQKFFRAENVRRYQTSGSGLGLYICKSIIERSKGKMGFKSTEGRGATFWFQLPIIKK